MVYNFNTNSVSFLWVYTCIIKNMLIIISNKGFFLTIIVKIAVGVCIKVTFSTGTYYKLSLLKYTIHCDCIKFYIRKMPKVLDVATLYKQLKTEWGSSKTNLNKCEQLLAELKVRFARLLRIYFYSFTAFQIALTQLTFLPTSNNSASKQELMLARDILEIGAQWAIEAHDIPAFERYMAQLKCYYFDYNSYLLESAFKYQLLGLNLLFLLSQNRVAEFHTELELLPADHIQNDVYVRHPLSIEQYLMEGSYNKVSAF